LLYPNTCPMFLPVLRIAALHRRENEPCNRKKPLLYAEGTFCVSESRQCNAQSFSVGLWE
jgi:hypothetical protein